MRLQGNETYAKWICGPFLDFIYSAYPPPSLLSENATQPNVWSRPCESDVKERFWMRQCALLASGHSKMHGSVLLKACFLSSSFLFSDHVWPVRAFAPT